MYLHQLLDACALVKNPFSGFQIILIFCIKDLKMVKKDKKVENELEVIANLLLKAGRQPKAGWIVIWSGFRTRFSKRTKNKDQRTKNHKRSLYLFCYHTRIPVIPPFCLFDIFVLFNAMCKEKKWPESIQKLCIQSWSKYTTSKDFSDEPILTFKPVCQHLTKDYFNRGLHSLL